jgi:hypothetical protein
MGIAHLRNKYRSSETDTSNLVDIGSSVRDHPFSSEKNTSDHYTESISSTSFSGRRQSDPISEFELDPLSSPYSDSERRQTSLHDVHVFNFGTGSKFQTEFSSPDQSSLQKHLYRTDKLRHDKENHVPDSHFSTQLQQLIPYTSSSSMITKALEGDLIGKGSVLCEKTLKPVDDLVHESTNVRNEYFSVTPLPSPRSNSSTFCLFVTKPTYPSDKLVLSSSQSMQQDPAIVGFDSSIRFHTLSFS